MISVTIDWVKQVVSGHYALLASEANESTIGNAVIDEVSTNSKAITSSALFIPLVGKRVNGHEFIADAQQQGAEFTLIATDYYQRHKATLERLKLVAIVVEDTTAALGDLARAVRQQVMPRTLAVTGSSGKTSVKEMAAKILAECGNALYTQGNFNNHIGVPLTLLRLEPQHQYAVIECGANHHGEIAYTVSLVEPETATITNAAASHLEGFGSVRGVAEAKSEIYQGILDDGVALINGDSEFADYWRQQARPRRCLVYSANNASADFYASDWSMAIDGCYTFILHSPLGTESIQLRLPGRHSVVNAITAAALCMQLGASLEHIKRGLEAVAPVPGRLHPIRVSERVTLIDDTYNANQVSMQAALTFQASLPGIKLAVLGDMAELGEDSATYHHEVGQLAAELGVDAVFAVGEFAAETCAGFTGDSQAFETNASCVESILAWVDSQLGHSSNEQQGQPISILFKGSRSSAMEQLLQPITQRLTTDDNRTGGSTNVDVVN